MELRVLRYFLAAAQEGSISAAAEYLHLTQPTLSRQLGELEGELGVKLFIRGGRGLTLTEDGLRLRRRAEDILELADRTAEEFQGAREELSGDVAVGTGEGDPVRFMARATAELRRRYPGVHFHQYSGDGDEMLDRLERGLLDFAMFNNPRDDGRHERLALPLYDTVGLLVRSDDPLAGKEAIRPEDLVGSDLLMTHRAVARAHISSWLGPVAETVRFAGTFNYMANAVAMVEEGCGRAICDRRSTKAEENSAVRFIPLADYHQMQVCLLWKKYQPLSRTAEAFLAVVREMLTEEEQ